MEAEHTNDDRDEQGLAERVLVIGTGFGGAVSACRLAQAGFDVHILERGRRYEPEDFPDLPSDQHLFPDAHRWAWGHDRGLWDVQDLDTLLSIQAAGYGGGSLIYANVHLRPPASVFDNPLWPKEYRKRQDWDEYFDLAAYMLGVAPIDAHPHLEPAMVKTDQLARATRKLRRADGFFKPPLAIRHEDGKNIAGEDQKACIGCGACCTGCPHRSKNTLDLNYLALAEQYGAKVHTLCEVVEIEEQGPSDWRVTCRDHQLDRIVHHRAGAVFLCAGSVHSTRLLSTAKLERSSAPELAGVGYFPGSGAVGMVYDTDHPQKPNFGPAITTATVQRRTDDDARFFMIQDGGYGRELNRLAGLFRAPIWLGRNRLTRTNGDDGEQIRKVARSWSQEAALDNRPPLPAADESLASFLDRVLDAIVARQLDGLLPDAMREAWPEFVSELEKPLQARAIVEDTLRRAAEDRVNQSWLLERVPERWRSRARHVLSWGVHACADGIARAMLGTKDRPATERLATATVQAAFHGAGVGRNDVIKNLLGYSDDRAEDRTMLLAMGQDAAMGELTTLEDGRPVASLDMFGLAGGYAQAERLMADLAHSLGGELRTNPFWAFLGRPVTVHNQGGCRMAEDPDYGVTDPQGAVHGCEGLYVMDGSLLCTSVGVNPSATIAAIAERNVLRFIRKRRGEQWPKNDSSEPARHYAEQQKAASAYCKDAKAKGWHLEPPPRPLQKKPINFKNSPLGLSFPERMQGFYERGPHEMSNATQDRDHEYAEREAAGRPHFSIELNAKLFVEDLVAFFEDERHRMGISGTVDIQIDDSRDADPVEFEIESQSHMELLVPHKQTSGGSPWPTQQGAQTRRASLRQQLHEMLHERRTPESSHAPSTPDGDRYMEYTLYLTPKNPEHASVGRRKLTGYKRIRDEPGLNVWRSTTSMYCVLREPDPAAPENWVPCGAGVVRVSLDHFASEQLRHMTVTGTEDPARIVWATTSFASFFFGKLQRIYFPSASRLASALFQPPHSRVSEDGR